MNDIGTGHTPRQQNDLLSVVTTDNVETGEIPRQRFKFIQLFGLGVWIGIFGAAPNYHRWVFASQSGSEYQGKETKNMEVFLAGAMEAAEAGI